MKIKIKHICFLFCLILFIASCGDKDEECSRAFLRNYDNDVETLNKLPKADQKRQCQDVAVKYQKNDGCKIPKDVKFTDAQGIIGVREFLIKTLKDACDRL